MTNFTKNDDKEQRRTILDVVGSRFVNGIADSYNYDLIKVNKSNFKDAKERRKILKHCGNFIFKKRDNSGVVRNVAIKFCDRYDGNILYEVYSDWNKDGTNPVLGWDETLTESHFLYIFFINFADDFNVINSWERRPPLTKYNLVTIPMANYRSWLKSKTSKLHIGEAKINDYPIVVLKKQISNVEKKSVNRVIPIRDIFRYTPRSCEFNFDNCFNVYHLEKCFYTYKITNKIEKIEDVVSVVEFDGSQMKNMNSNDLWKQNKIFCHWYGRQYGMEDYPFYNQYEIEGKNITMINEKKEHFNSRKYNKIICKEAQKEFKIFQ